MKDKKKLFSSIYTGKGFYITSAICLSGLNMVQGCPNISNCLSLVFNFAANNVTRAVGIMPLFVNSPCFLKFTPSPSSSVSAK